MDWTIVLGRCFYLSALNSCITNLIHHYCRLYCNTLSQFFSSAILYFLNIGRLQCFRVQFTYWFCSLSFTRRKLKKIVTLFIYFLTFLKILQTKKRATNYVFFLLTSLRWPRCIEKRQNSQCDSLIPNAHWGIIQRSKKYVEGLFLRDVWTMFLSDWQRRLIFKYSSTTI